MSNAVLTERGDKRTEYIREHMGVSAYPDGFTIKDIVNKAGVGHNKLFASERQVRDHMRTMADRFNDVVSEKTSGTTTYYFRPNLYAMFHFHRQWGAQYEKS